jgi:hypothetical protein
LYIAERGRAGKPLQTIEKEAAKRPLRDRIKLMETLVRQLREKAESAEQPVLCGEASGFKTARFLDTQFQIH